MPSPSPGDAPLPEGMPAPRPFAHLHPTDGACLMETASLLAGGSSGAGSSSVDGGFSDSPATTHPALAALARVVNDSVDEATRHRLWPLAADLAHARPAARAFAPLLIADVLREAQDVRPRSRVLAWRRAACLRRARRLGATRSTSSAPTEPDSPRWRDAARWCDGLWWRGPGRHHLERALRVLLPAPDADARLARLLQAEVASATGRTSGDGPVEVRTAAPQGGPAGRQAAAGRGLGDPPRSDGADGAAGPGAAGPGA